MKNMLAVMLILSFGCSIPRSEPSGGQIQGASISTTGKVLIMHIYDGQEPGQPVATGSGSALSSTISDALQNNNIPFTPSFKQIRDMEEIFTEAKSSGCAYVLCADYTLWEDNATAWSGNGDKVAISVKFFNVSTRSLVAASSHKRVATGFTLVVGSSPQRFLPECVDGALNKIYRWKQLQ